MVSYTAKAFALFAYLLACGAWAKSFSCDDLDTKACNNKFSTEVIADFRALHLNALRKLFTTYIDIGQVVSAELPENYFFKTQLDEAISKVSKDLEDFNAYIDDHKQIAEIIKQTLDDMSLDGMEDKMKSEQFNQMDEKYKFTESLVAVKRDFETDAVKLWTNAYAGLRPEDLKAEPIYETTNNMVKYISNGGIFAKLALYAMAKTVLGHDFALEYFDNV